MTYTDSEAPPHSFTPGSIRAAWSYRAFRTVWTGQALSQTGTWMQNVALPAYVQARWDSGTLVGAMVFAQLGPMLLLSIPGSILANKAPRKPWLLIMPTLQMFAAIGLAWFVHANASFGLLFAATAVIGTANALNAPAFQSSIPMLVHRRDLAGAISLNTAQLNGTRVLGPLIVGREGEGVFGITWRIGGTIKDPDVLVNPLSVLAPGFLRRLFELSGSGGSNGSAPPGDDRDPSEMQR